MSFPQLAPGGLVLPLCCLEGPQARVLWEEDGRRRVASDPMLAGFFLACQVSSSLSHWTGLDRASLWQGRGGACHRLGHHLPHAVPSAGTTSLPRLLSRRSLAPGPPLPQPPSQSLWRPCRAQRPALLSLPASAIPEQTQDAPTAPGSSGSACSWGCYLHSGRGLPHFSRTSQEKPSWVLASEDCILTARNCGEIGVSWPQAPHIKLSTG